MRQTRLIMGMPVTVEIVDAGADAASLEAVFSYFTEIDERFSTYKNTSEIMRMNRGEVSADECSADMIEVLALAEKTKRETNGFFDIKRPDGLVDPSGIVKGWAIKNAANQLLGRGFKNFYVDAGGDIQTHGTNSRGEPWSVGVRNPKRREEIVKIIYPRGAGVATSGSYIRGSHIYNPHNPAQPLNHITSLTVIASDICEADRFATAAFAMGDHGIEFLERMPDLEGYAIDANGRATVTSKFNRYTTV